LQPRTRARPAATAREAAPRGRSPTYDCISADRISGDGRITSESAAAAQGPPFPHRSGLEQDVSEGHHQGRWLNKRRPRGPPKFRIRENRKRHSREHW
jgi:hypothetical protein